MTYDEFLRYKFLLSIFQTTLDSLEHLNEVLPKLYLQYFESEIEKLEKNENVSKVEFQTLNEIMRLVKKKDYVNLQNKMEQLSEVSLGFLKETVLIYKKKLTAEAFLRLMSITFLITVFEDFLKKTLKLVFFYKRESLKSEKFLTYETIIDLKTYDKIIENMIENKAKTIIEKDISDLGKTLANDFGFNLIDDNDWKKFTEVFYRRHVIVHNNSEPDEEYRLKTGDRTITDLLPTEDYIKQTLVLFKQYSNKISEFFSNKYPETSMVS